jgi:hypothetical protein
MWHLLWWQSWWWTSEATAGWFGGVGRCSTELGNVHPVVHKGLMFLLDGWVGVGCYHGVW